MEFRLFPGAQQTLPENKLQADFTARTMLEESTSGTSDAGGFGGANNASIGIGEVAVYATSTGQLCSYISRAELAGATYTISSKSCHSCAYSNEVPVAVIHLTSGKVVRIIFDDLDALHKFAQLIGLKEQ